MEEEKVQSMEVEKARFAEFYVAGAILIDSSRLERVNPGLQESDFQHPWCRKVYRAARALQQEGKRIDSVTIQEWLQHHGENLSQDMMKQIQDVTPTIHGIADHSRIVHEAALRRALQRVTTGASEDCVTPVRELISKAREQLESMEDEEDLDDLVAACDVPYEPPRWLIEPYIQLGKGTMIQADPGTGKTAFVCALAAAVSTGRGFLGLRVVLPGNVLMLSSEDDTAVLRGRIESCGGSLRHVHFMKKAARLNMDSPEIERAIRRLHAKLVILDPLQAFLGAKIDLHRANETRPVLARFFEMCAANDCACVIVAHLGKVTQGKSTVTQSLGSVDIPGAMRSILHIARNQHNPGELVAVHVKSSNAARGKGIAFRIGERGAVEFTGFSDLEVAELQAPEKKQGQPFKQDPLAEVLLSILAERGNGYVSYDEIQKASVKKLGCTLYGNNRSLRAHIENPEFLRNMLEKERVRITRQRTAATHGVYLMQYSHPEGYQQKLPQAGG